MITKKFSLSKIVLVLAMLIVIAYFVSNCVYYAFSWWLLANIMEPPTMTRMGPERDAWNACLSFIEKEKGISREHAPEYSLMRITNLPGEKYIAKILYAKELKQYNCTVFHGNKWELISLEEIK